MYPSSLIIIPEPVASAFAVCCLEENKDKPELTVYSTEIPTIEGNILFAAYIDDQHSHYIQKICCCLMEFYLKE